MLDRVSEFGMEAVAITDHGTLSGAIEFYTEARKRGIKPIIGLETYVAPRAHTDKSGKTDANPYHLILLAKNFQGYQNLMQLASIAHLEGFYYKPRVDRALLEKYHEGLIALSACLGGEVASNVLSGNIEAAEDVATWYQNTFGKDNYYLEIQDHEDQSADQKTVNTAIAKLSAKTGIPMVVTADSHYCKHEDKEAHEILLCVQTGSMLDDKNRMSLAEYDLHVSSPGEISSRWADRFPDAIANTVKIAAACNLEIPLGNILIPKFDVPTGQSEREYLHELAYKGLAWRYGGIPREDIVHITKAKATKLLDKKLVERMEFELGVIARMGYDGYFLIVADFINWGKNQGIIFGPGRGSAAGSIVSYALNITDLDPIKYDLIFERFLNPDRVSMPDIDIDIQDTRRQEVIDYVVEKYGQDRVAQIITFGTMAARNAVRDTGRVLGMPYGEVDAIAKIIPQPIQGRHVPLRKSIVDDPDLKKEYDANPRAKNLIDLAMRLEGTIRSNGVHAAGVVIAPNEIVNYTPLQRAQKGGISTQYSMGPIEELGLLKMDFLGLSNLTIIKNAMRIIKKVYGVNIDLAELPLDDEKTFELFGRGDTTGVFQFESAGMKRYLKGLKPTSFDDIIAMAALYRPGPMQWIEDFIDRKHGRSRIEYIHPIMESALKNTYGILVYQEQVMQVSKDMCGFTGAQADSLRRAIGKKKPKELAKMKHDFIEGAIKTVKAERAMIEEFWSSLEAFAAYCFPKAHAACYALIAYQTAYLKAHFPLAFMAALMTSDYGDIDRIAIEVSECQRMGVAVLPPDVNQSFLEFGIVPDTNEIRFGLSAVKNVGTSGIEALLAARQQDGPFSSIEDFAKRVSASEVNKKVWESLIKCGAMDGFGERGKLLFNLDTIISYAQKIQKNALSGQIDIFGSMGESDELPALRLEVPTQATTGRERLAWEKELLGLYISEHPLDNYSGFLAAKATPIADITTGYEGRTVTVGGVVTTMRKITTKNGDNMAFVTIEDKTGQLELIVFPKSFAKYAELWQSVLPLLVTGKVNTKDREGRTTTDIKILVDSAVVINDEKAISFQKMQNSKQKTQDSTPPAAISTPSSELATSLVIAIDNLADSVVLMKIKELLSASSGQVPAYLIIGGEQAKKIRLPFLVEPTEELITKLKDAVGQGKVSIGA